MKKVAIVTVDFNGHEDTIDLLNSARLLNLSGLDLKTILVDNGSDRSLPMKIEKKYKFLNLELLQTGINKGFTGGYNFGMRYAISWGADCILIVNNDVLFGDKNLLPKLLTTLNRRSVGIVTPKIFFAPGFEYHKERYTKDEIGKVLWFAGGNFNLKTLESQHRGLDEPDQGKYNKEEPTNTLCACCALIKREVIESIGYFDEKYFAYYEDNDYLVRLVRAGFKSYYNGNTFIYHKVSQTAGIGSPWTDYFLTRNKLYFGMKYTDFKTRLALLRHAIYYLRSGRPMQRRGVLDFFQKKMGSPNWLKLNQNLKRYPLELSVVIVNFKTPKLTQNLLRSIYTNNRGSFRDKFEVVVLDNASNDGIEKIIRKEFPQVKFIKNRENSGFAAGYNKAIGFTKGKFILMLNSDIEVLSGSIKRILSEARRKNDSAVVVGKLILPNRSVQKSCFNLPTITGAIKEYFLGKKNSYSMFYPEENYTVRIEGAVMACYLIPRTIWNKVGELSEKSFMYFEDIEYCRRLKKYGIKIFYCPKAKFIHHHGASSKQIGDMAYKYLKRGAIFYHGRIKYLILYLILWLAQKINPERLE